MQAATIILDWLATQPGDGWQQRWDTAVPDDGQGWIELLAPASPWLRSTHRVRMQLGLSALMLVRLIRPSYRFLRIYNPKSLYSQVRETFRPDLFAQAERNADRSGVRDHQRGMALAVLSNLVLHTGKDLDQLDLDDFTELRWFPTQQLGKGGKPLKQPFYLHPKGRRRSRAGRPLRVLARQRQALRRSRRLADHLHHHHHHSDR